jgi:hypothetical protein
MLKTPWNEDIILAHAYPEKIGMAVMPVQGVDRI